MKHNSIPDASLAWATYVLGHDIRFLQNWHISLWNARQLVLEGTAHIHERLSDHAADVCAAIEPAAVGLELKSREAIRLGRWLEEWRASAFQLLHDLKPAIAYDSDIDWDALDPPGIDKLRELGDVLCRELKRRPHFARWYDLGNELAGDGYYRCGLSPTSSALQEQCRVLRREGRYSFLAPVLACFDSLNGKRQKERTWAQLIDNDYKVPTYALLDAYIRRELKSGIQPEPTFAVTEHGVRFLGEDLARDSFHPAEWKILYALCLRPRTQISSDELIRAAGLRSGPKVVEPQVSRIRHRLRPILERAMADERFDEDARCTYIRSWRFDGKPPAYSLELDRALVMVTEESQAS